MPHLNYFILFSQLLYQLSTVIISHLKWRNRHLEWLNNFPEVTCLADNPKFEPGSNPKAHVPHSTSELYMPEERLVCCHMRILQGCVHCSGKLTRVQGSQPHRQRFELVILLRTNLSLRGRLTLFKLLDPMKDQRASFLIMKNVTTFEVCEQCILSLSADLYRNPNFNPKLFTKYRIKAKGNN